MPHPASLATPFFTGLVSTRVRGHVDHRRGQRAHLRRHLDGSQPQPKGGGSFDAEPFLLVAEQVSGLYARADALILATVNYHRDASRHGRIERTRINAFLTEALKQLPEAQNLRILDRNGILRYGNDDLVDVSFC